MNKFQKTEEQDLIEKTARIYQSITRGSMDGFWIVDMQGRFLDVFATHASKALAQAGVLK